MERSKRKRCKNTGGKPNIQINVDGCNNGCDNQRLMCLLNKHRRNKIWNEQHLKKDKDGNYLLPDGSAISGSGGKSNIAWGIMDKKDVVANTSVPISFTVQGGDSYMLSQDGLYFVAPATGLYILTIGGALIHPNALSNEVRVIQYITLSNKNREYVKLLATTDDIRSKSDTLHLDSLSTCVWMEEGQFLSYSLRFNNQSSTVLASWFNSPHQFTFALIR